MGLTVKLHKKESGDKETCPKRTRVDPVNEISRKWD